MGQFRRGDAIIHFDDEGAGFPVLTIALGGMRSTNDRWELAPWNPRRALVDDYRVIGMDQRNAGRSWAPIAAGDGWSTFTADQLALLDHLGIERCHLVGMCIGGPYLIGLLRAAPERFASAVLLQPVGIEANRHAFHEMFDGWRAEIADEHPEASDDDWSALRDAMWSGDYVLTATPDEIAEIETPLLVAMGNDLYHPSAISRDVAGRAAQATLVEEWKQDDALVAFDRVARDFLAAHTP